MKVNIFWTALLVTTTLVMIPKSFAQEGNYNKGSDLPANSVLSNESEDEEEMLKPIERANKLRRIGFQQLVASKYQEALQFLQESLKIYRDISDAQGEAFALYGLGWAYDDLGQLEQAIESYQESLLISQKIGNHRLEATNLNLLGYVYFELGQYTKAIEFNQQSLAIAREIDYPWMEALSLADLGLVYFSLGEYEQAMEFTQTAQEITQNNGWRRLEAYTLNDLGKASQVLGEYQQAVKFHQQSINIAQDIGNRYWEAIALNDLGRAYQALGKYQQAMASYQQALTIAKDINYLAGQGQALSNIGNLLAKQNQPELAIIFYKQSVNVREAIRQNITGLSRELQESYLETVADTYRSLADLLLQQDRVLEAQGVLDLLKVQELQDYLHNIRGSEDTIQGVIQRNPEEQITTGYEVILDQAIELGKELTQLTNIPVSQRTDAQKQRVVELRKKEKEITKQFLEFFNSPEVQTWVAQLRQNTGGQNFDLENHAKNLRDNLRNLQQDAVILYPLVLDDRLELVLVTPDAPPVRRTVIVKREELNRAIVEFRNALKNPTSNAEIPAQKLYDWLIKPLETDLTQAEAKTIIYAPDGQLRYIPLAALYDGKQWLVQKFQINNITALSLTDFNTKPQEQLQILAGAFTQGSYSFEVGEQRFSFQGLPFAGVEVENLAQTIPNTTKLLDKEFNPDTVYQMNDYSIVHLATHAAFVVGQPRDSFILFGDGNRVTLPEVESWDLSNVDLVVLSACETGLGDKLGNGEEILGFGYLMQQTGARAAIASLWSVNDGGTQVLMNSFYEALTGKNITKAEALRQAQIALITGDHTALGEQRGTIVATYIRGELLPKVKERLHHPYYWASFILIGNGL